MPYNELVLEKEGRIARIIMNRPEKRNPLSYAMMDEIIQACLDVKNDPEIRVLIVKGAGPSFSGGHALEEIGIDIGLGPGMQHRPTVRVLLEREDLHFSPFYKIIFNLPKVTIAQIHGYCIHGAFNLQMVCDISIVAEDAHLEPRVPPLVQIPCYMPLAAWAKGMGRRNLAIPTNAKDAERLGWITRAVPAAQLEDTVEELAREISHMPLDALELNKQSLHVGVETAALEGAWKLSSSMHALGTHQRFRTGEYSMFKARRDGGASGAIRTRAG